MRPFTPDANGGRNVECRILVVREDGETRPCGATLKHQLGMHRQGARYINSWRLQALFVSIYHLPAKLVYV